ncbi:MAG: class I tRNA ligase family protein, partial [Elusimicrobia bacterium]|nr:class I tRNA ligase family protein [Elusimicrobiota bacterium]
VGVCYRCGSAIEPLVSLQWFVRMKDLARPALEAHDDGRFVIHPESWAKPYKDWLAGIKDWCVSRQIWWGHRIPVWYCLDCNDVASRPFHQAEDLKGVVSDAKPASCPYCRSTKGNFMQDPDVLDTWFSSSLWPMSVFGWPETTPDFKAYYPTSVLVTGYEILYLWVARMQMMGLEFTGRPPFSSAVIHGIVRDKSGRKMSKSLGNVIDPLVVMGKFGTDALRFSLMRDARLGKDIHFSEDGVTGARNFVNKIWNTARFALMNLPERPERAYSLEDLDRGSVELADRWILSRYGTLAEDVAAKMNAFQVSEAADAIYGFLWDEFCDWYVELAKLRLGGSDERQKDSCRAILAHVLCGTLKLLHPFMPFITEELYAQLKPYVGERADFLLDAGVPKTPPRRDEEAEGRMAAVMEITGSIRTVRAQLNVPPGLRIRAVAIGGSPEMRALARERIDYIQVLARLEDVEFPPGSEERRPQSATALARGMTFLIPLAGVIDFAKERARLEKELAKTESEIEKISAKVENPNFLKHAGADEVQTAQIQYRAALEKKARLKETLSAVLN